MSIFKESFKEKLKDQIKQREIKVGQNTRTYHLQRQCSIRLASGVNIDNSPNTAINNVLEGGTKKPISTTTGEGEGTTTTSKLTNRSGFGGAYDAPSDGYGYVPMPGITSVNIETKTAYGSLREAKINFECHNLNQLSILERLYMRPGYPCLLEWGLSPYINSNDKKGSTEYNMSFISDNNDFFNSAKSLKNENDLDVQEAIQRLIREKKEQYDYNYDGMYGIIKNFNYSVRPDGGFKCTTELIAIGEVLDSLLGSEGEENSSTLFIEEFLEDLNEYSFALSDVASDGGDDYDTLVRGESLLNFGSSFNNVGDFDQGPIAEEDRSPYENSKFGDYTDYTSIDPDRRLTRRKELKTKLSNQGVSLEGGKFAGLRNISVNNFKDIKPLLYIKWGNIVKVLNHHLNDINLIKFSSIGKDKEELKFNQNKFNQNSTLNGRTELDIPLLGGDNQLYRIYNFDISINPKICLLPENWKLYGGSTPSGYDSSNERLIREVWFEANYLYKTFKSEYYIREDDDLKVNPEFSIGKFLKKIWEGVNDSCAGMHNFQLFSDFENPNIIKVIDLEFQSDIDKNTIHKFNVLNKNSIVRDFNYDISIPSALTSTIAIAAQNAKSPQTLQEVTLRSFNKGLNNRFYDPIKSKASKVEKAIYNKKVRAFQKVQMLRMYLKNDGQNPGIDTAEIIYRPGFQKYWEFIEAICELQLFTERLKGYTSIDTDTSLIAKEEAAAINTAIRSGLGIFTAASIASVAGERVGLDPDEVVLNTPTLQSVLNYHSVKRRNTELPLQKKHEWVLAGDAYADWDFIPPSDISKARNYLKKVITLKRELKNYELQGNENEYKLMDNIIPDITNIIPLKLNMKLDGISGIVIGNVFNLIDSRLPKSYHDSGVSFIVTTEQQSIEGQDWTTTITGQTVLL
jgi:hypothetical protein